MNATATATEPTTAAPTKPPIAVQSVSTQVSISLDLDTYTYFETEAKKDERSISKFIARTLKAYVAEKAEKMKKKPEEEF